MLHRTLWLQPIKLLSSISPTQTMIVWCCISRCQPLLGRGRAIGSSTQVFWLILPFSPRFVSCGRGGNKKPGAKDLDVWWDKGKLKLKDQCEKLSKQEAKTNFERQRQLEEELHDLINQPKSSDILQQIGKIQEELGAIHNKTVTGAKICSKEKFYHEDEKPTK